MADFLINTLFRITVTTLNYVSSAILADILLHPLDFATVLLQIGFDPEGVKNESATLVSVILQYALFTFYIPYLLTSVQSLQYMGMPHPSIFYYVNYIYSKEGFSGCYRGLLMKICERLIVIGVNERVKKGISKGPEERNELGEGKFTETLIKNIFCQFLAVLVSHPFHVLMVASFAEFTYNKKSSTLRLFRSVYDNEGCLGFFTGLMARLLGEILSLIFSTTYTAIINKQWRPLQQEIAKSQPVVSSQKNVSNIVNYVTDLSRFTAFKPSEYEDHEGACTPLYEELSEDEAKAFDHQPTQKKPFFIKFIKNIRPSNAFRRNPTSLQPQRRWPFAFSDFVPLTSKLFYYIIIRDYLSKKISNPFFLVCHCAIILGSGWDKFPASIYSNPVSEFQPPDPTPAQNFNF